MPDQKEILVQKVEPKPGQVVEDNFLAFLFGMKADDAKKRYKLTLLQPPKGDVWYHYVDVEPRDNADPAHPGLGHAAQ